MWFTVTCDKSVVQELLVTAMCDNSFSETEVPHKETEVYLSMCSEYKR